MARSRRTGAALAAALACATWTGRTEADEPPAASAVKAEPARRWYGWQTLMMGLASMTVAGVAESENLAIVCYLSSGLAVHALHGHGGRAAASLVLRLTLPLVGLYVGGVVAPTPNDASCGPPEGCPREGALDGLLAGIGTAIVLDVAALSWETLPSAPPPLRATGGASFVPLLAARAGSAVLGLGGAF